MGTPKYKMTTLEYVITLLWSFLYSLKHEDSSY